MGNFSVVPCYFNSRSWSKLRWQNWAEPVGVAMQIGEPFWIFYLHMAGWHQHNQHVPHITTLQCVAIIKASHWAKKLYKNINATFWLKSGKKKAGFTWVAKMNRVYSSNSELPKTWNLKRVRVRARILEMNHFHSWILETSPLSCKKYSANSIEWHLPLKSWLVYNAIPIFLVKRITDGGIYGSP